MEIQHHNVEDQITYNRQLYELSKKYGIPLIAGTDTHALNETHMEGRKILQLSKGVHFAEEDAWDLTLKSYLELCKAYKIQNSLPEEVWREAIAETCRMADRVEEFTLDKNLSLTSPVPFANMPPKHAVVIITLSEVFTISSK